jgi:hypothetical protein
MRTPPEDRLLRIIDRVGRKSPAGCAPMEEVRLAFGTGFDEIYQSLCRRKDISRQAAVGTIALSPLGQARARAFLLWPGFRVARALAGRVGVTK